MDDARNRCLANLIPACQRFDAEAADAMGPADRVRHFVSQFRVALALTARYYAAAFAYHVMEIVAPRSGEQMVFIHARGPVALVKRALPLG